jgi:thiol-disulfide isomerase/thioredoxin
MSAGCDRNTDSPPPPSSRPVDSGRAEFSRLWFWVPTPEDQANYQALTGRPMPALDLKDWQNYQLPPEQLRNRVILLDFFATWCGPCIESVPVNNELYRKYRDRGFELIGVCTSDRGQELMEEFVKKYGQLYPVARDPHLKTQEAFRIRSYPTYALIDRRGVVRAIGLRRDFLDKAIQILLEEQP